MNWSWMWTRQSKDVPPNEKGRSDNGSNRMNAQRVLMVALVVGLAGCASTTRAARQSAALMISAEASLAEGQPEEAMSMLRAAVAGMPSGWKVLNETRDTVSIAYWDQEHFDACAPKDRDRYPRKTILWATPSYSKAYFLMAFIEMEYRHYDDAGEYLDLALELEPTQPTVLSEKGVMLQMVGEQEEALRFFDAAIQSVGCVTKHELARAFRMRGASLIEINRLDEAEQALRHSLTIEPNNSGALNELEYIRRIREGAAPDVPLNLRPARPE